MVAIMRAITALIGLFNAMIGLGFLLVPEKLAGGFFLAPLGSQGLATLRADFTGFFIGASAFALVGAWRADARPLAVPIVMLGLALTGRAVSLFGDGMAPTALPPMLVEIVMLALLGLAARTFKAAAANGAAARAAGRIA